MNTNVSIGTFALLFGFYGNRVNGGGKAGSDPGEGVLSEAGAAPQNVRHSREKTK
jgi:hypothetical protein